MMEKPTRMRIAKGARKHSPFSSIEDAIAAIKAPVIEVHISNVHAREDFRKMSHVSGKSVGSIFGLGLKGYELAVKWFVDKTSEG